MLQRLRHAGNLKSVTADGQFVRKICISKDRLSISIFENRFFLMQIFLTNRRLAVADLKFRRIIVVVLADE
jgi:hypothetical protein